MSADRDGSTRYWPVRAQYNSPNIALFITAPLNSFLIFLDMVINHHLPYVAAENSDFMTTSIDHFTSGNLVVTRCAADRYFPALSDFR